MSLTKKKDKKVTQDKPKGKSLKKAPKASTNNKQLSLPTKPNVPPVELGEFTTWILGEKGIGKSSLAAQFPDPVTFMFELGRRNLPIYQIPQKGEQPLNWSRFCDYVELVIEKGKQTVIIDTVDRCYEECLKHHCHESGVKDPGELGNGSFALWNTIKREFEDTIISILEAGISVVFISHSKTREIFTATGGEFNKIVPTCAPACEKLLKAICDFMFFYGYHGKKRALTIRGDELISSACGVEESFLEKKTSEPIATFSAGKSAKEAYQNLVKGFENKLTEEDIFVYANEEEEEEEE